MDGSTIVIPSAVAPSGLAREDALFRIVYYGEALRAITEHVNDTLIAGACGPMIEMLDEAFDKMSETRETFGPEEFTLFVMSRMLGRCESPDAAREFQVGAASYILKSADTLPETYQPVIADARRMLGTPDALAAPSTEPSTKSPDTPVEAAAAQSVGAYTNQATHHQRRTHDPVREPAPAPSPPETQVTVPDSTPAAKRDYNDPSYRPRRRSRSLLRRGWKFVKRVAIWSSAVGGFAVIGLVGLGALDPVDMMRSILNLASRVLN